MSNMLYSSPRSFLVLDKPNDAVRGIGHNKPVIEGALCSSRQKPYTEFRLVRLSNRVSPNTGFFTSIAAGCEYGRITTKRHIWKCHKNERGWRGVRMIEPARDQSSLFGQTFKPEFEDCISLLFAVSEGWLHTESSKAKRTHE